MTGASGERSFSSLKLIKTYVRSTMSQDRLSALAVLSIEHEVRKSLDMESVIARFAEAKARKVKFYYGHDLNCASQPYNTIYIQYSLMKEINHCSQTQPMSINKIHSRERKRKTRTKRRRGRER